MAYDRKDHWHRKAKEKGYRSRAAFKLLELDRRYRLLRKGIRVLDLGCAPGGWLQIAADRAGKTGLVVGVDRLSIDPLPFDNLQIIEGDITDSETIEQLREALGKPADLVLSDMAPDTSGIGFADHARSLELIQTAIDVLPSLLRSSGTFVAKVFDGPDLNQLISSIKKRFKKIQRFKPEATRKGSRELYLVALDFTGPN